MFSAITSISAIVTVAKFNLVLKNSLLTHLLFSTQIDIPLLLYHGCILIEVKLTIYHQFNSLQLHTMCRWCPWISSHCDYCSLLHKFFTFYDNLPKLWPWINRVTHGNVNMFTTHMCDANIYHQVTLLEAVTLWIKVCWEMTRQSRGCRHHK